MKRGAWIGLAFVATVALIAAVAYFWLGDSRDASPHGGNAPVAPSTAREHSAPPPAAPDASPSPSSVSVPVSSPANPLRDRIDAILARLARGEEAGDDLAALKRELLGADPQQAIAAIMDFLASGRDAATRQGFAIGEGGALDGAPTLRVMLMDLLGQISKQTGSDAAAGVARRTLESKNSADEWAVSLRNVAWHEPAAMPYLAGKVREMLTHQPWRESPTDGMLEAFDVAVFSRDPSLVPALTEMLRLEGSPLQRAAAVALDRLGEVSPLAVMSRLNSNPGELSERPLLRADYFAKADLSDPAQRSAVETYLSRADVSTDEKTKLLKGFATPASFVSPTPNLLTPNTPPDENPARDQAFVKALQEWQTSGRFPELRPAVEQMQQRLGK